MTITSAIFYCVNDLKILSRIIINILTCVQVVVTFQGIPSVLNAICANTEQT